MNHIDPDLLALLALGERAGDAVDVGHLEACAECRAELAALQRAAAVGRSTLDAGELLDPDPRVWESITRELAAAPAAPAAVPEPEPAPVVRLRRRWMVPLLAAAAVVVLVGGVAVSWWALRPAPAAVIASATLDPFPAWVGSGGSAVVEERSDGSRVIDVSLDAPDPGDGFREAWLIDAAGEQLVSLGVVDGSHGRFVIPAGLDLTDYRLVDVSEEPFDGDPAHSGDSIVRGKLSPT